METAPLTYGPELGETLVTAGLDYYKPTMSQLAHNVEPDAEVTFTFKNRGEQRLADFVTDQALTERFESIRARGFQESELQYLAGVTNNDGERVFNDIYLEYLRTHELPEVHVTLEEDDLAIRTTGPWPMVTFWETVIMCEINEMYFEGQIRNKGIAIMDLYEEGDRRLSEKIAYFQQNPDVKFADFGTRRHFSWRWHKHVVERLAAECPDNFIGTSNVQLAASLGLKPIGTFAHEMPMVYAGLADARGEDIRASHGEMLDDWFDTYGDDLAIALSDTFGSDFFFEDFGTQRAQAWRGTRHDSGDPIAYGEKGIAFYEANDIDPRDKVIVFSDGLDVPTTDRIHQAFKGRVGHLFGIGTNLSNDVGLRPLNIVMKATNVNGADTVKLSDNPGKHTGPEEKIDAYKQIFGRVAVTT